MFLISLAQCDLQVQSMKLVPANMNRNYQQFQGYGKTQIRHVGVDRECWCKGWDGYDDELNFSN